MNAQKDKPAQNEQHEKRTKLLAALCGGASVAKACRVARVARRTAYYWREKDPEFANEWEDAIEEGTDNLEDEAFRRAMEGVKKPVIYKGKVISHVHEYSDTLLIFMLKARRPKKYREQLARDKKDDDTSPPTKTIIYEVIDGSKSK